MIDVHVIPIAVLVIVLLPMRGETIGVCNGRLGDDLPTESEVVSMYTSNGITGMRIYSPNHATLKSLQNTGIKLLMDVEGKDIQSIATNKVSAISWVMRNIKSYFPAVNFKYIIVGNEVIGKDDIDIQQYILPAIRNINEALNQLGIDIKVSTSVDTTVLQVSYPPSSGSFTISAGKFLNPIIQYLETNGAPLLANVYPYFSYSNNIDEIPLQYATFIESDTVVKDGLYTYHNLFDATTDSLYAAMEKVGCPNVSIVVSETGWPTAGGLGASIENAKTYNSNLILHVPKGTPKRPGIAIEAYIFAMFNENLKNEGVERNWGLFYPNKVPVYPINFLA